MKPLADDALDEMAVLLGEVGQKLYGHNQRPLTDEEVLAAAKWIAEVVRDQLKYGGPF